MALIGRITALALCLAAMPGAAAQDVPLKSGLDHVAVQVADQQTSIDFYASVFGLSEIPSPFPAGGPRWMRMSNGVELHIQAGRTAPIAHQREIHFAIAVNNLDHVIAALDARQLPWMDFQGRPRSISTARSDGVRQIFCKDPDGYWIEVNDALKKRP